MIDNFLYDNGNYEKVEDNLENKIKQQSVNWKRVWKKSYSKILAELYMQRDAYDRETGAAELRIYYKRKKKSFYFIKK